MSKAKSGRRRRAAPIVAAIIPPIVTAVVQPVAKRLSRMEALLIEMRHEQDVQLKRTTALQAQLEALTEHVSVNLTKIRLSLRQKGRGPQTVQPHGG
jgi:hypothetical protein